MAKDELTVYWSPAAFSTDQESWNLLYPEPDSLKNKFQDLNTGYGRGMLACPATKNHIKNIFVIKSAVEEDIDLPVEYLRYAHSQPGQAVLPSKNRQIVTLYKQRPSSLEGYSNLLYNLSYVFFSEESLVMEFLPPYLPPKSPSPNSILASGEFDIGQWFRPTSFDYHVPLSNSAFQINIGDELAYVKFKTDKKVQLKRFMMTDVLNNLSVEMARVSDRYNYRQSLLQRYQMSKNSNIMKIVQKEIQKNLI